MFVVTKSVLKKAIQDIILGDKNDKESRSIQELKIEIEELKAKKRMEIEEIKHLNRLAQEKRDIALEKEKIILEREYETKARSSLVSFHKKIEDRFGTEMANFKELYKEIINRLPNVNMEITKEVR